MAAAGCLSDANGDDWLVQAAALLHLPTGTTVTHKTLSGTATGGVRQAGLELMMTYYGSLVTTPAVGTVVKSGYYNPLNYVPNNNGQYVYLVAGALVAGYIGYNTPKGKTLLSASLLNSALPTW